MGKTVHTIQHTMTADHSRYDRSMRSTKKETDKLAGSSRDLVSSIALIDGPLGGVASRASNLNSLLSSGGIAFAAFAASISAAGFATVKMLKTFSQVEVELGKTEAILRSTGNASGFLADELDEMARRQARATLASSDDIRKAINSLLTFTSVGRNSFEDVISLSQDMASIWGGSAATNARKLGKALDDPIKQISRLETTVGAFRTEQREMIIDAAEAGEKFKAQSLIIKALEERIGNAGEGAGKGLAGSVDLLGQEWEELFEAIERSTGAGSQATSMFNAMAGAINDLSNAISPDDEQLERNLKYKILEQKNQLEVLRNTSKGSTIEKRKITNLSAELTLNEKALETLQAKLLKQSELAAKTEEEGRKKREAAEQEKRDLETNKMLDELIFSGRQVAFKLAADREKERLKALDKETKLQNQIDEKERRRLIDLKKEMESIRKDGLDDLTLEKEVHSQNIALLKEYQATYGESARITEAINAEKRRTLDAQNDAVFNDRSALLSSQLGEVDEQFDLDKEDEIHAKRLEQIKDFREQDILNQKAANAMMEEEDKRHQEALTNIVEFSQRNKEKAQRDFYSNTSSLMNSQSRKLFEIGKAAAISNAVVSATEAVPHAYKWGTKIGGPVLGTAFAAAAIAATATQIQAINDTSFGSKSSSSTAGSASASIASSAQTQDINRSVEIHFNGDVTGLNGEILAETLKEYIDQTDFILVERASRNGQELAV